GPARAEAMAMLGRRCRPLGWGAIGVLVATGAALAAGDDFFEGTGAARTGFVVKVCLAGVLIATALLHDLVFSPRLARGIPEGKPKTSRSRLILVGWLSFATTIVVPVLGVVLAELG